MSDRLFKRWTHGNTRVSIYYDEGHPHPWELEGFVQCGIACWTENDYFGNFLPEDTDANECLSTQEEMKQWIDDNPHGRTVLLSWWGRCGSDTPMLEMTESIDDADGAIFINADKNKSEKETLDLIKKDLNTLNAYLGSAVFFYEIETLCPTCEQWVCNENDDTSLVGGYFHNLDNKNGGQDLYGRMITDWSMTPDLEAIASLMRAEPQH